MVTLTDFNPAEDAIEIKLDVSDPLYSVTSAALEVVPAAWLYTDTQPSDPALPTTETGEETRIVVTYETAQGDVRDMVIQVKATGLSWDNIVFVGPTVPSVLRTG